MTEDSRHPAPTAPVAAGNPSGTAPSSASVPLEAGNLNGTPPSPASAFVADDVSGHPPSASPADAGEVSAKSAGHDNPSAMQVGLKGCCPRCGKGRLFKGFLSLAPRCETCGLDYGFIDTADGPAFFVMSFVGIVVVGLALWVEFTYEPPIWLHMVMWFSLTGILSLALVRPLKGIMVALQFQHRAEEGRLER